MDIKNFIAQYKDFLISAKTERECIQEIEKNLKEKGFLPLETISVLQPGDCFYQTIKGKTLFAGIAGTQPEKVRLIGSHVDSPKLDLRPEPLYEQSHSVLFGLHTYGWIKPYQWVNVPLELHGIIFLKDGTKLTFPQSNSNESLLFTVSDLPIHISNSQLKESMQNGFKFSQLNAIAGGTGANSKRKDFILDLLESNFGIEEEDFICADLCLVPYNIPEDLGLDRNLLGGYGHDDRICVFASLQALMENKSPEATTLGFFIDKEEVASAGDTSAQSFILRNFYNEISQKTVWSETLLTGDQLMARTQAISADVTTAVDPNFPEKFDLNNSAYLGEGVVIEKFGAAGAGKFRANEARAEYMHLIRSIVNNDAIPWQSGTIGKVEEGGGGTIAAFLARYGMDCVDAGPSLLGMHSPFEIGSKIDFYNTYLLYKSFYQKIT